MPYLDISKIELPKQETDYNVWADYIELLTMLHPDRKLSVEAIKDRLLDENDDDAKKALRQINAMGKIVITPSIDRIADDQFEDDTDPEDEQRIKTAIIGVIDYMKCRKTIASNYYPFKIDNKYSVSLKGGLTDKNKIYIILLISSLIRVITREGGFSYRITHRFESLCEHPFGLLIPTISKKEFFGAGGSTNETGQPTGQLFFDKVSALSKSLRLHLHPDFTQNAAGVHNVGDGGLDWVAWVSFADNLHMLPTYFAQCACGNDWEDKLFDANKSKWGQFILFGYDYQLFHFIPKSFRELDNKWLNNIKLHSAVLIDRFRIIELLEKSDKENDVVALYEDLLTELETAKVDFN
jgi:hypothetical protein